MSNSLATLRPVAAALRFVFAPLWYVFELFCNITDKAQQIFGVIILVGMWGLLLFNMLARWTDWFTTNWSIEITSYMVAWSIFIMMGPITRSNEHIKVTFLPEKLLGEKRGSAFIFAVESVIGLILCLYFSYHAYDLLEVTGNFKEPSSAGWEYPMKLIRSGILLGFLSSSIYYLERNIIWIKGLFAGSQDISSSGGGTAVLTGSSTAEDTTAVEQTMETGTGDTNNSKAASEREQE